MTGALAAGLTEITSADCGPAPTVFVPRTWSVSVPVAVGVPLIAVVQGLFGYIAYLIAGVAEPGFYAVLTGFASILPLIGTGLVWIPMSVYLLANGLTWQGIFVLAWGLVVLSSMDNVVRFILAKPSLTEYSGNLRGEMGITEGGDWSWEAGGAVGGPIVNDKIGFRASAYYRRDGGYIDRVPFIANRGSRERNSTAVRSSTSTAL